jgi:hypothetical protein
VSPLLLKNEQQPISALLFVFVLFYYFYYFICIITIVVIIFLLTHLAIFRVAAKEIPLISLVAAIFAAPA